jgi:sugar lactone lactonase YvrE
VSRLGLTVVLSLSLVTPVSEPAPRKPASMPLQVSGALTNVSGAVELADGRVVISDMRGPAVWTVDPKTGALAKLGSPGAGPDQYVQPGGFYQGANGATLLLDRAQARVMLISPQGEFAGTYSVARKGVTSSSDEDRDRQRLDARGFVYFADRSASPPARDGEPRSMPLLRMEPKTQAIDVIAQLRLPEAKSMDMGNGMTISRGVVGSPGDGWGVTPDGRVAIVRGQPYRVDWITADGKLTQGTNVAFDPIPMTQADRDAHLASTAGKGPSVGMVGGGGGGTPKGPETTFAATKAPFAPDDVVVSADAQVWVRRSRPHGAASVVVDVFDDRGARIDRLELPDGARIVGFGRGAVYVWAGGKLQKFARK